MENPVIFFPEPKKAVIKNSDVPKPEVGQVLIKTSKTLISIGTEMTAFSGEFPEGSSWEKFFNCPYYPGYNNIGTVVDVGERVDKSYLGKRFATNGTHAAYILGDVDVTEKGGNQQKAAGQMTCYPVPGDVADDYAVFFTIPKIVMNGIRTAKVQWGECAVVYGLGLLGQFAVRFCRQCGAMPVIGVDLSEERLSLLPMDEFVCGVNPAENDVLQIIKDMNHGRSADVVFELTGRVSLLEKELPLLREKGRLILLSSPKEKITFDFQDYCAWNSYRIIGCHNFSHPFYPQADNPWTMVRHVEQFFDLLQKNQIDIERLISLKTSYKNAPEVYSNLLNDRSNFMGIIFDWENL
jgi:2-desacetyl-2-hydroxyethyl bacteriochlorophyllide A dehydrogenase